MGQVKKQYQEWVEQSYPTVSPTGEFVEPKEQWTKEFEKFIDALLTKKLKESNDE
jgi:hypothetical protein